MEGSKEPMTTCCNTPIQSLPSAIVAKMLNPDKKVLAVVGDGGFMMNSQEIETALRYNIPVVVLILNDNAFGFIKWKQKNMKFKDFGLDYKEKASFGTASIRKNSRKAPTSERRRNVTLSRFPSNSGSDRYCQLAGGSPPLEKSSE